MSDYSCCIYRSKDPVRNFKIRVTLSKATGHCSSTQPPDKELTKLYNSLGANSNGGGREEVEVNWQTKIFSRTEFERYSSNDFEAKSILDEHYKEECIKLKERNYQPGRIFTYIDSDPCQFVDEIECEVSHAHNADIPAYLQKPTSNLVRRRPLIGNFKSIESNIPHKNIVNYTPDSAESRSTSSAKIIPFHTMYIMADLSNKSELNKERVLCSIKIDANGSLVMKPDFSRRVYSIYTYGASRETYEYMLQHVSCQISQVNLVREMKLHKELYMRHSSYIKNLVGNSFKMPAPGVMKVHVFGEIISAKNFDYDDLHVYFQLELPRNWHIDPSAPLSGFTQTSRTKAQANNQIAHFSHPFEFDLYYKNDTLNSANRDLLPTMPRILFEVASYDSWNRYRTEGYTWTHLPMQTEQMNEELACWRPRGDSVIYELRRFFIGGSPELEDLSYVAVPSDHGDKPVLSRMGFRTASTGSIKVRMNVAFQSQVFMGDMIDGKGTMMGGGGGLKGKSQLLDRMGNYSNLNELIGVLEQFNVAKGRMIAAREDSKKILEDE